MNRMNTGQVPHPSNHHVHEEVILIREGSLVNVTIAGKASEWAQVSSLCGFQHESTDMGRNVGRTNTARYVLCRIVRIGIIVPNPSGVPRSVARPTRYVFALLN